MKTPDNQSKYIGSGAYDPIAAKVFRASRFQRFLLEYDDARSGGFGPLKNVPDDRTVVLGLVTTKHATLESRESSSAASARPRPSSRSSGWR